MIFVYVLLIVFASALVLTFVLKFLFFLVIDLEADPFVSHPITTAACDLYYIFGFYMAPLTEMDNQTLTRT